MLIYTFGIREPDSERTRCQTYTLPDRSVAKLLDIPRLQQPAIHRIGACHSDLSLRTLHARMLFSSQGFPTPVGLAIAEQMHLV